MKTKPVLITAVIPAYNEANRIGPTVKAIMPFVDEALVIDDGSQDETALQAEISGAQVIRQPTNRGYITAIKRGFVEAKGHLVVTIDADGELSIEKIPDLVQPILDDKADMVQGCRQAIARPSERVLTWLASLRAPVGDPGTGFRALKTDLARQLNINGACICGILSLEVISRNGRIAEIPIKLR